MQDNTAKIYIIRDEDEPIEGPYWSSHVRILVDAAKILQIPLCESSIADTYLISQMQPWDLILYRPTYLGAVRTNFGTKIRQLPGFVINKRGMDLGCKQEFAQFCKEYQIPTPKTWLPQEFLFARNDENIPKDCRFVIKKTRSSQGNGVFGVFDMEACIQKISTMKTDIIIQEFCALEKPIYDIRLMMVGRKVVGAMKRVLHSDDPVEFRSNLALGTSSPEEWHPVDDVILNAQNIQEKSGLDWVGLDVILYQERYLFLECNMFPGLNGISQICPNIARDVLISLLDIGRKGYE